MAKEGTKDVGITMTAVAGAESTTEGNMGATELKEKIRQLKEEEKRLKDEAKKIREQEKIARAEAKAAGITQAFSRIDALSEYLKSVSGKVTMDEIISGSNTLYAQKKSSQKADNPKEAKSVAQSAVHLLVNLGWLTKDGDNYTRV
jgi:CHASE3 domain sensor protein